MSVKMPALSLAIGDLRSFCEPKLTHSNLAVPVTRVTPQNYLYLLHLFHDKGVLFALDTRNN